MSSDLCVLGCGDHRVVITNRCGGQVICDITANVTQINYGRVLDDTSEAIIVVDLNGAGGTSCCDCLGTVHTWINSVIILRDGDIVWGPGPLVNILDAGGTVTLLARDVSAWLDVRVIHETHKFHQERVDDVLAALLTDALEPDDPCDLLRYLDIGAMPELMNRRVGPVDGYAGDVIRDMARNFLDYTVVGNQMIFATTLTYGPFTRLGGEDFTSQLTVEERGTELGTKWWVIGNNFSGVPKIGTAGGVSPYYGLVERVASEDGIKTVDNATSSARSRVQRSNPAPLVINVPDDAALAPTAPVCFKQLVPGTLMDIVLQGYCQPVSAQLRLTAVKVTVQGGDERVGVTLNPVGSAA